MKKTGLLLVMTSAFLLTGCEAINNLMSVINNLSFDFDQSQATGDSQEDVSYESYDHGETGSTSEGRNPTIINKIKQYVDNNGFYVEGEQLSSFVCAGKNNVFHFCQGEALNIWLDYSGSKAYEYIKNGGEWIRLAYDYSLDEAYEFVFDQAITLFESMQTINKDEVVSSKSTTYLNQACKEYKSKDVFSATMYNEYEWIVNDKDGFTLKSKACTVSGEDVHVVADWYVTTLNYSFTPELPTDFVDLDSIE